MSPGAARSQASVVTAHARRYMIQLCKHFGHKVQARFDDETGEIAFDGGVCRLGAGPVALDLEIEAAGAELRARLEGVIDSHLRRFAFREPDLSVNWRPAA
ncbi:MAG TPA: DUF2218 domain-containing protein [Phenylobacterium sp.]|uniref:DUF2218 domain-containing protein n=1 Tax=Phenylobacterium sp. TaxID=1871053 RepID=UPI002C205E5F|nr:DUF2218 domain-containing protein [Phenylobacterium sp.]HMP62746.1 DUF2218 domain-containing protein [Phenylobacterium sp.]